MKKSHLFISLAFLAIILFVLFFIHICSSQAESKVDQIESDKQEEIISEKEPVKEEITDKTEDKEPVEDKHEEPAAEQKQQAPQEQIIMFDVDAAEGWQDSGIVVTPDIRITITYVKGNWTIDYNRHSYVGVLGYPALNSRRDYPAITIGALIGKIGEGEAFKIGKYYEITESQSSGNLHLRMNDLSAMLHDNRGSITVKIIIQ